MKPKFHFKDIISILLGLIFFSVLFYTSTSHAAEVPEAADKDISQMTKTDMLIINNSLCAGYYNAMSIGEMGSIESLVGLWAKNDMSKAQKLAVRLFTEHSNAYKRMGAMRRDAYDFGGRMGGQIYMSGQFIDDEGSSWSKADAENYCSATRKGIVP